MMEVDSCGQSEKKKNDDTCCGLFGEKIDLKPVCKFAIVM